MNKSHEIITVTYAGDLANLYYHVLSLKRFWKGEKNLTVVVEDFQETVDWCENFIKPILSDWDVKILLSPEMEPMDGWQKQQILKLWASSLSNNEYSIILDCKNFLIRDFTFDENFVDGKLLIPLYDNDLISDDNSNRYKKVCEVLDIDYNTITKCFCITPFFWDNDIVRDLFDYCKSKNIDYFSDNFINGGYESGYYWVFAQNKVPYIQSSRPLLRGQYGGCGKEFTMSLEQFQQQIDEAKLDDECRFFVFHRFHATPIHLNILSKYLQDLNVITDENYNFYITTFKNSMKYLRPTVQEFLCTYWENS